MVIKELEGNTESKDESCISEPNESFSSNGPTGQKNHNEHLKKENIKNWTMLITKV